MAQELDQAGFVGTDAGEHQRREVALRVTRAHRLGDQAGEGVAQQRAIADGIELRAWRQPQRGLGQRQVIEEGMAPGDSLVDRLADTMYRVLDAEPVEPARFPTAEALKPLAGKYEFSGTQIEVVVDGKRVYIEGPGEPRHRLVPLSEREFWSEALQTVAIFEAENGNIARVVFGVGDHHITAARVP